jgi:hypothetical protein
VKFQEQKTYTRAPEDREGTLHHLPSWEKLFEICSLPWEGGADLTLSLSFDNQVLDTSASALVQERIALGGELDSLGIQEDDKELLNQTYTVTSVETLNCEPPRTRVVFKIDNEKSPGPRHYILCNRDNPFKVGDKETFSKLVEANPSGGRSPGLELMQQGFDEYMARQNKTGD